MPNKLILAIFAALAVLVPLFFSAVTLAGASVPYGEIDNRTSVCAQDIVASGVNGWMGARNKDGTLQNRTSESRYTAIYTGLQKCGVIPPGDVPSPTEISSYFRRPSHFGKMAFLSIKLPDSQSVTYELEESAEGYKVTEIDQVQFLENSLSKKPDFERAIYPEPTLDDDRKINALELSRSCERAGTLQDESLKAKASSNGESQKPLFVKMSSLPVPCSKTKMDQIQAYLKNLGVDSSSTRQDSRVRAER